MKKNKQLLLENTVDINNLLHAVEKLSERVESQTTELLIIKTEIARLQKGILTIPQPPQYIPNYRVTCGDGI